MKILHLADLHLDTPFVGLGQEFSRLKDKFVQAPYQAFSKSISLAIEESVDLVLIAGDLYDSNKQSVYAQHYLISQLERLKNHDIPVAIIHGNHDYIKTDKALPTYPSNVYLFASEEVTFHDIKIKSGESVRVYGFSYQNKWIEDSKIDEFPSNPQLTDYTIGMIHGQINQGDEKNQYAPFTLRQLLSKDYDYWALGHVHQGQVLNQEPLVIYPGTIQGSHRNESGDKGCYIVNLEKNQASSYQFHSLASIKWVNEKLDIKEGMQASDLIHDLNQLIANYSQKEPENNQSIILSVDLTNSQMANSDLYDQIISGEILENIRQNDHGDKFVIIRDLRAKSSFQIKEIKNQEKLQEGYDKAVLELLEGNLYERVMDELFSHTIVQAWLKDLKYDDKLKKSIITKSLDKIAHTTQLVAKEVEENED